MEHVIDFDMEQQTAIHSVAQESSLLEILALGHTVQISNMIQYLPMFCNSATLQESSLVDVFSEEILVLDILRIVFVPNA